MQSTERRSVKTGGKAERSGKKEQKEELCKIRSRYRPDLIDPCKVLLIILRAMENAVKFQVEGEDYHQMCFWKMSL